MVEEILLDDSSAARGEVHKLGPDLAGEKVVGPVGSCVGPEASEDGFKLYRVARGRWSSCSTLGEVQISRAHDLLVSKHESAANVGSSKVDVSSTFRDVRDLDVT